MKKKRERRAKILNLSVRVVRTSVAVSDRDGFYSKNELLVKCSKKNKIFFSLKNI